MTNKEFIENMDYSEEWLLKEKLKLFDEQRKGESIQYIKIKKIDLIDLVLKFIKLNEKGEL